MAYYNSRRSYGSKGYGSRRSYKSTKRKRKFTKAEQIAFKLGQEHRVRQTINSNNKDTRVFEAYAKGYHGVPAKGSRKPLFSN